MSESISFKCMHCQEQIDADSELAGKEAKCPGCSKSIVVPKPQQQIGDSPAALKERFPALINHSDKTLTDCTAFLKEYMKSYCEAILPEGQNGPIIASIFSHGIGSSIAKKYENAVFSVAMEGSTKKAHDKLQENLFGNKKLNKQIDEILIGAGVKVKKKSFLGLFG